MKVLILSQWYYPENVSGKINSIGQEFIKNGHKVICFTGFPNYPEGKVFEGYKLSFWKKEEVEGVNVFRFPSFIDHSKNKFKRILNYFSLSISTSFIGLFFLGKPDVIFLYDSILSMGLPALLYSKIRGIPIIFEIQDMFPETLSATGMVYSKRILSMVNSYSKVLYKNSKFITVISNGFKRNLITKGIDESKINIIPNWAEDYFYPMEADEMLIEKYELKNKFNLIYAGNIGIAQELENLLKVAESLRETKEINLVFIGDGNDKERLQELCAKKNLSNITFIPKIPIKNVSRYLSMADVLLIHLKNDPIFEITIPSKTLAYLAVGKPILCIANGEVEQLLSNANAGISCQPGDLEGLKYGILKFYNMKKSDRVSMGENGRKYFIDNFTKSIVMKNYQKMFEQIEN